MCVVQPSFHLDPNTLPPSLCERDRNMETLWRQLIILVNLFVSDKMCSNFGFILKQFRKRYKLNFNYENFIILQEFVQNLQKCVFSVATWMGWGGGTRVSSLIQTNIA